jgi:hypothetical protein
LHTLFTITPAYCNIAGFYISSGLGDVDEFLEVNPYTLKPGNTIYSVNPKKASDLSILTGEQVLVTITITEFPASCGYETISWPTVPKTVFNNEAAPPVSITDTITITNHPSYSSPCPFSSFEVSRVSGTGTVTIGPNLEIDMNGSGSAGTFKFTYTTISGVKAE